MLPLHLRQAVSSNHTITHTSLVPGLNAAISGLCAAKYIQTVLGCGDLGAGMA